MLKLLQKWLGINTTVTKSPPIIESQPDLDPVKLLNSLQTDIESFATNCISITIDQTKTPSQTSSRFGGFPYLPKSHPFPIDNTGKPLRLLAQLNFADIPHLPPYPKKGLLQFYIANDDVFGLDFDDPLSQKGWKVLFFENINFEARTDFEAIYNEKWEDEDNSPFLVKTPLAIRFSLKKDYPNYPSIEYHETIQPLLKKIADGDYLDELEDLYIDKAFSIGHKIGGFPYYTQNEVRTYKKEYQAYKLLFQMDSDDDFVIWGDVGVANFFIKPVDLANQNFSNILYNWDCH